MYRFLILSFVLLSCSSTKDEYDQLTSLISNEETIIAQTNDFKIKIETAQTIIKAIDAFTETNDEGEYFQLATGLKSIWENKIIQFNQENEKIVNLIALTFDRAVQSDLQNLHPASNIQDIKRNDFKYSLVGNIAKCEATYNSRMVGAFLGTHVFNIQTTISGEYSFDDGKVIVKEVSSQE